MLNKRDKLIVYILEGGPGSGRYSAGSHDEKLDKAHQDERKAGLKVGGRSYGKQIGPTERTEDRDTIVHTSTGKNWYLQSTINKNTGAIDHDWGGE